MTTPTLTLDAMRHDIARLLEIDAAAIADDDDLMDLGLDSMRLMQLATVWREACPDLDFGALAERPQLSHWRSLLPPTAPGA